MLLNYDELVPLDAEALAGRGIGRACEKLRPLLARWVETPSLVDEDVDPATGRYLVRGEGVRYVVSSADTPNPTEAWGRATFALFAIVNAQLERSRAPVRFFAVSGGHELGGLFLRPEDALAVQRDLRHRTDWPYLPTLESPWYGQPH